MYIFQISRLQSGKRGKKKKFMSIENENRWELNAVEKKRKSKKKNKKFDMADDFGRWDAKRWNDDVFGGI